jgi:hypothetical protein
MLPGGKQLSGVFLATAVILSVTGLPALAKMPPPSAAELPVTWLSRKVSGPPGWPNVSERETWSGTVLENPAAGPRGRVVVHLAEAHRQDAAVGHADGLAHVEVDDAAASAQIARAVDGSGVVVHLAEGDGHLAVVEDAASERSRSSVAVDHAGVYAAAQRSITQNH